MKNIYALIFYFIITVLNINSQTLDNLGLGLTKYFSNRAVKVQLMARYFNFYENTEPNQMNLECMIQVRF